MAYDDILARLLCTLESRTLGTKLGAAEISNRFRSTDRFADEILELASDSIGFLIAALNGTSARIRFNKATLFTWLIFISNFANRGEQTLLFANFLADFETSRAKTSATIAEYRRSQITKYTPTTERSLLRIFSDRSSSRVSDVSSVLFRDVILWLFFHDATSSEISEFLPTSKFEFLRKLSLHLRERRESTEEILEEQVSPAVWGAF
jgi:hypothetical protein